MPSVQPTTSRIHKQDFDRLPRSFQRHTRSFRCAIFVSKHTWRLARPQQVATKSRREERVNGHERRSNRVCIDIYVVARDDGIAMSNDVMISTKRRREEDGNGNPFTTQRERNEVRVMMMMVMVHMLSKTLVSNQWCSMKSSSKDKLFSGDRCPVSNLQRHESISKISTDFRDRFSVTRVPFDAQFCFEAHLEVGKTSTG